MSFSSRRGRPRHNRPMRDSGTPELVAKRAFGLTVEALDLCLSRDLITPQQHWCGIHLRWLYTLRFGAPGVRAADARHMGGMDIRPEDPAWRALREAEYQSALATLATPAASLILSICVFNERPSWLRPRGPLSAGRAERSASGLALLQEGFGTLEGLWCRAKSAKDAG